jgi:hypothetical protein
LVGALPHAADAVSNRRSAGQLDMRNSLLVGLGAGIASALVLVAAAKGSMFGLFAFIFMAPLPIIIVGLGWGWPAASTAAAAAGGAMVIVSQPKAAILHLCAIGLPMAAFAYFLLLNRFTGQRLPDGNPAIEWYPVGRVVAFAALIAGGLASLSLFSVASDMASLEAEVRKTLDRFIASSPGTDGKPAASQDGRPVPNLKLPSDADIETFAKLMTRSFAAAVATFWMALACLNIWLGGLIARASGRLARPWPDLSLLSLPRETPLAFVAAIGLSFLDGYAGLIASGFASAFFFAYLLVGLAIIHNLTRGTNARGLILFAVYLALFVLNPFSGIIIAMIGIAEPISPLRRRFSSPAPPNGQD